jgi:carbon-monoxide dehydrogenase medium subunit
MITAPFEYHRPETLADALALLAEHRDDGKLLAGGHSLIPVMKFRLAQPAHLIDLARITELRGVREEDGRLFIGAMTTHHEMESSPLVREKCPLLALTPMQSGDAQVRNKGTIGGSAAHADPAADWPAALLAAEAEFLVQGTSGQRVLKAEQFFVDTLTTALQPDEILTHLRVVVPPAGTGAAYEKFAQKASGFAICGVAALITRVGDKITHARIAITGVGPKPYRARAVEARLKRGTGIAACASHAADDIEALGDIHASAEYRQELAKVYTRRAIDKAIAA